MNINKYFKVILTTTKMRLLYTLNYERKKFPSRNFKASKDLNTHWEYPYYPEKGMWLSPVIETENGLSTIWAEEIKKKNIARYGSEQAPSDDVDETASEPKPTKVYTLPENDRLYHFRTVNDYIRAYMKYPLYLSPNRDDEFDYDKKGEQGLINTICKMADSYTIFSGFLKEMCQKSGIMEKDVSSDELKKPLKFLYSDDDEVDIEPGIDKDGKPAFRDCMLRFVRSYAPNDDAYSPKDAIIYLKQICAYILKSMKQMSRSVRPATEDTIIGIDYNKMRADGYKGFYVHSSAVEEAKSIQDGHPHYDIIDPLHYWYGETICVWAYCFID